MPSDDADIPSHQRPLFSDQPGVVRWAVAIGVILAAVGLIDGVVMVAQRREATCPNGRYFPEGTTDFTCYVHPQAAIGIAVAAMSVILGILVVLAGIVATATIRNRPR